MENIAHNIDRIKVFPNPNNGEFKISAINTNNITLVDKDTGASITTTAIAGGAKGRGRC